jgi:DNA ligase (NAD+)
MDEEAKKLIEELKKYREAYYNLDPMVPDNVYDAKRDRLKQICPDHFEVHAVGASPPVISVWEKVKHDIPMGSLDKVNSLEELIQWAKKTGAEQFHITDKIDGSSMELVYEHGKLIRCVTRGDGFVGEDVTKNIKQVPTIPKDLPEPMSITVRGEIVMLKNIFAEKYAEIYANPRNTAAAKVREKKKGGEDCANLTFLAYWIKCEPPPKTMQLAFKKLMSLNFKTPESAYGNVETIQKHFETVTKNRQSIPYDIDGQVVSVDNIQALENLGEVAMRPRGQIAWKFESEKAESKVLDVVWQVGPTGRVTPVAKVSPTPIGGVTIESVSLHNLKMFNELKLFHGCRVLIERRNDVIPYISQNLDS